MLYSQCEFRKRHTMKKLLITLLLFLIMLPAVAKTLTGGVVYTVESARKAAFEGIEYEISMEPFKKYMTDPGFISPAKTEGGKPKVSKRGRWITYFSDGGYGVTYKNDSDVGYYYNYKGKLEMLEIDEKNKNAFPYLSKQYDINGKLLQVSQEVSERESYVFDTQKKLLAHWINQYGYNEKGELEKTRR